MFTRSPFTSSMTKLKKIKLWYFILLFRISSKKSVINSFSSSTFFSLLDLVLAYKPLSLLLSFLWCSSFIILPSPGPVLYLFFHLAYSHPRLRTYENELQTFSSLYYHDFHRLRTLIAHFLLAFRRIEWLLPYYFCLLLPNFQSKYNWTSFKLFIALLLSLHKLPNRKFRYKYDAIKIHHKCTSFNLSNIPFHSTGISVYAFFHFNFHFDRISQLNCEDL